MIMMFDGKPLVFREREREEEKNLPGLQELHLKKRGEKLNHGGKSSYEEKTNVKSYWPKGRG